MLSISPNTLVRDLLTVHPEAFAVLERHGMCADCRANPPAVPLQHFARKHCGGDIGGLLAEITATLSASDMGGQRGGE